MSARHKRARSNAKKELNKFSDHTAPTITAKNKTTNTVDVGYPQRHACKLDYIDWEPYSNGKVLSIGKCVKLELKKAA